MKANKKIKLDAIIFYICYSIMLAAVMFKSVNVLGPVLLKIYNYSLILLFISFAFNVNKLAKNKAIMLIVLLLITIFFIIKYDNNILFKICLFSVTARNVKFDKIVKLDILLKISFLVILAFLYFNNMTEVHVHYRNGIIRHSMGFTNPNIFSTYIMSVVAELLYIMKEKIKIIHLPIIAIACLLIDYYSNSRTQILCIILFTILLFINRKKEGKILEKKFIKKIFLNSFSIFAVITYLSLILYSKGNSLVMQVDSMLNGRLHNSQIMLKVNGITPLGNKMNEDLPNTLTVDNTYTYFLIAYGVIPTIIMSHLFKKYMDYCYKKKKYSVILIMFVYFLAGFTERICIRIHFNVFILLFSKLIFENLEKTRRLKNEAI